MNYKKIINTILISKDIINRYIKEGDIVLLAGKGHEEYQLINGKRVYFSDRETAIKAAKRLKDNSKFNKHIV